MTNRKLNITRPIETTLGVNYHKKAAVDTLYELAKKIKPRRFRGFPTRL